MLVVGAVFLILGAAGLYEGKPASPGDGVLARALLFAFEPEMASFLSDAFCVAAGLAALLYGFLRYRGKA
jgi:hypothetical protein